MNETINQKQLQLALSELLSDEFPDFWILTRSILSWILKFFLIWKRIDSFRKFDYEISKTAQNNTALSGYLKTTCGSDDICAGTIFPGMTLQNIFFNFSPSQFSAFLVYLLVIYIFRSTLLRIEGIVVNSHIITFGIFLLTQYIFYALRRLQGTFGTYSKHIVIGAFPQCTSHDFFRIGAERAL